MSDDEPFQRARSAAIRLLSYRPRSETEIRVRLRRRFPPQVVDGVVEALLDQGLLDDIADLRAPPAPDARRRAREGQ